MESFKRVLSIQSHVVSGYVGNKCAVFPLQIMGFEVDAINSVQLSNHTGYKTYYGQILNESNLSELITGLVENELHNYSHLLTGYTRCPMFLKKVAEVYKILKKKNPGLIYVCDPVMGDNKKMYVPKEILDVYKNEIIHLTDILTPNEYELELLTGITITTPNDIYKAMNILYAQGCKTVVVSSSSISSNSVMKCIGRNFSYEEYVELDIPIIDQSFIGTGDFFTALLLIWMNLTNNNLKHSIEKTVATIQAVLKRTIKYTNENGSKDPISNKELKLIQSLSDIQNPEVTIFGTMNKVA
ncbi:pyridoxal kinase-like [Metopolophium dirhodum]|uniref:pyridoxal kinase-like n=1 Tax=Metopolophium dirhodum TaxID=44670 RepID=UPI00298FC94F|nr:pyridoxal kinase-like [Metopolophium dirhodum]XP_060862192.1 pyridoxal kinase-like [Metopolophium dirhodum]XP_060862193.1 pyridoxal kinase-like [Metopolophium dirhodum]XP_060862194.1 pyridoxal kinase-like [Metopolophium dirhodum]XP_060862195.1 pyridoxal kinase-like [Metopolophium dirhodum]XP_060862196.1 pyridoxal kinase-like [Metopolophium dirhodum]XP_060862197.1 pyridoxal kinase-like [Metopolophium dirhodum]XP_060862198.1 pyridoxal kinase-like [Metopolophium dirhodum]XP_060862199.1 pyri